jgi:hypothetical protein
MPTADDDRRLRTLAFAALPSAWAGLSDDARQDVIDLLSTYDYPLAFDYLLGSPAIDAAAATAIRAQHPAAPGQHCRCRVPPALALE